MSIVTVKTTGPVSSGEIQTSDPGRTVDIQQKHEKVSDFLASHGYDALLLRRPENFAWLTSGGDCSRRGSSEETAALFITPEARVIITSNVDSALVFESELPGLGFQLKERSWHLPKHVLFDDLCRGRNVASDTGFGRTVDVSAQISDLRMPLSELECQRCRKLGRLVAHAVEATARHFQQGQSEAEIAGELAHRLVKNRIIPERIQIWADGQAQRYPHWSYGTDRVERHCVLSAVGRRWGLCQGATRTVSFGEPPRELMVAHHTAMLAQATGMVFSQPDWELFEIWNRVKRIYEKFGFPDEWQRSDQAEVIGYEVNERPIVPKSEFRLTARVPIFWHTSIGPAVVGDTILVAPNGFQLLTPCEQWPMIKIAVKGRTIERPNIFRRSVPRS